MSGPMIDCNLIEEKCIEAGRCLGHEQKPQSTSGIKHFDETHFTAVTIGGRKFLYCPVGKICSWSEGDYDNKWCHWCQKFFNEIK